MPAISTRLIEAQFDAQQVIAMALRLPVAEIEALGESTDLREAGLWHARSGEIETGRRLLAEARTNQQRVDLSTEAATMFETYQLAAEAYVDFVERCFADADAKMRGAIAHANRLRRDYGYVTELRRIHLGANLLRVSVAAGAYDAASTWGLSLLLYLSGQSDAWPWPDLALAGTDAIGVEERLFVLDQVLEPTADALQRSAGSPDDSRISVGLRRLADVGSTDPVADRTSNWARTRFGNRIAPPDFERGSYRVSGW